MRVVTSPPSTARVFHGPGTRADSRAAISGHLDCVRLLVENGASLTKTDKLGFAAAAHARRKGHMPCARVLNEETALAVC
ncbi:unnamed protein product [Effrenium voratum]|uniref:Ankyrin repeat protein n=1 Tax=Effrenium voratum TaxID=2562239 RepID=A0AA36MY71_9DINO|nr:unnamed protein product [Effrenium voratum]